MKTHGKTWRRAPFTLVELLVVIAIISILAGMLFPPGREPLSRRYPGR